MTDTLMLFDPATATIPVSWPPLTPRTAALHRGALTRHTHSTATGRATRVTFTHPAFAPISLTHAPDGTLTVDRPGGIAVLRSGRVGMPTAPGAWPWHGGLPRPTGLATPALTRRPDHGDEADEADEADEVGGPLCAPVFAAWVHNHGGSPTDRRAAWAAGLAVEEAMWRALRDHLAPEPYALTIRSHQDAAFYAALVARPDVCDHVRHCPGLGPLLTVAALHALPTQVRSLEAVVAHCVAEAPSPSIMVWLRHHPLTAATLPPHPQTPHGTATARAQTLRAGLAAVRHLNPQHIQRIARMSTDPTHATDMEAWWLLATLASLAPQASLLLPWVIVDPLVAVRTVNTALPPHVRAPQWRGRVEQLLRLWQDWIIADPEAASRATGARGATTRAVAWDRTMRAHDTAWAVARDAFLTAQATRDTETRTAQQEAAETARRARAVAAEAVLAAERAQQQRIAAPGDKAFPRTPRTPELQTADWHIRWLDTDAALREEGTRMRHCVGDYGYRCRQQGFIIFAVERADGTPFGTLSFTGENTVHRFLGVHNGALPQAERETVVRLVRTHLLPEQ